MVEHVGNQREHSPPISGSPSGRTWLVDWVAIPEHDVVEREDRLGRVLAADLPKPRHHLMTVPAAAQLMPAGTSGGRDRAKVQRDGTTGCPSGHCSRWAWSRCGLTGGGLRSCDSRSSRPRVGVAVQPGAHGSRRRGTRPSSPLASETRGHDDGCWRWRWRERDGDGPGSRLHPTRSRNAGRGRVGEPGPAAAPAACAVVEACAPAATEQTTAAAAPRSTPGPGGTRPTVGANSRVAVCPAGFGASFTNGVPHCAAASGSRAAEAIVARRAGLVRATTGAAKAARTLVGGAAASATGDNERSPAARDR